MNEFEKMGFRCGLEVHQRIDTHKLFCNCYADQSKPIVEKTVLVQRQLRASTGESGIADETAVFESNAKKTFEYQCGEKTSCIVEADEEPPRQLRQESLEIALQVAKTLNAKPVNEIHVMRKTIVDGSAVSGFQRSALIALKGQLETKHGKVGIDTISIEEESAGIIEKEMEKNRSTYRLDRLGIPLIEIATGPDVKNPEHAREVAQELGSILRNTGKVQRGIGTIRQDVNVSITDGARVEIKGAQELELISKLVENEVTRQSKLLEIKRELINRGAKVEEVVIDATKVFENTSGPIIRTAITGGGKILAVRLIAFGGVLGRELLPGLRFGTELADRARAGAGVKGIIHSDENLSIYGIEEKQVNQLCDLLDVRKGDGFVLCAEREDIARAALKQVLQRAHEALKGVPGETRRADGTVTRFMRPIAGAARMYPETDAIPICITSEMWDSVNLIENPEHKIHRYTALGLNSELAQRMAASAKYQLFEKIFGETRCDPVVVAVTILETLTALRREGIDTDAISESGIMETLREYARGNLAKAAIPEVLKIISRNGGNSVNRIISEKQLHKFELEQLKKAAIEHKGNIGEIMKQYRMNIEANELVEVVKKLKAAGKLQ